LTDVLAAVDGQLTESLVWVSLSEAAQRQQPPISKQAIHKRVTRLVAAGRLSTKPGPRGTVLVNIVALNRAIAEETDPAQDLRNNRAPAPVADDLDIGDDEHDAGEATDRSAPQGKANYHRSRAEREAYQAENARLDLDERLDRLADKDDVERRTMTAFRRVRDRLLAFPATVAEKVTVAPDARAVRAILTDEMRRMLDQLAGELDHLDDDGDDLDASGEPN